MLKYLIVQLSDNSVSICHYPKKFSNNSKVISSDVLYKAIYWAMQQNLSLQFLYPDEELPNDVEEAINTIHSYKIANLKKKTKNTSFDAYIIDGFENLIDNSVNNEDVLSIKTNMSELVANQEKLFSLLQQAKRVNVILNDIETLSDSDFEAYSNYLESLSEVIKNEYAKGHAIQLNLLTDRLYLEKMNNCNAGVESITLAPDGKFYICPAFYLGGSDSIGDLDNGLDIKNPQLYKFDHAPICKKCDAFQCHRCVWLNKKTTLEVNTPSHQQCVISHIERNASRKLLDKIRTIGEFLPEKEINEINYLDPFDLIINKK